MDLFAPAQTDTTHVGLATQHCLTLIIKLQEAFYPAVCASGDVKRIAELFSKSPPSGLNISPGGGLVHFADAVCLTDYRILVVAIYDGEWDPYIDAFLNNKALIDGLNVLLKIVDATPEAPVPPNGIVSTKRWIFTWFTAPPPKESSPMNRSMVF